MEVFIPQNDKVKEKTGYRPTKVKKTCQRSFSRFLLVEAEGGVGAIGAEAEAIDKIAASTSLVATHYQSFDVTQLQKRHLKHQ